MADHKLSISEIRKIIKTLKQFRADREEFIDACSSQVWKEWATTPHFYLHWTMANVDADLVSKLAIYVLKYDKNYKWFDVADTIRAMYIDPEKWVVSEECTLKYMLKTYGQPE